MLIMIFYDENGLVLHDNIVTLRRKEVQKIEKFNFYDELYIMGN